MSTEFFLINRVDENEWKLLYQEFSKYFFETNSKKCRLRDHWLMKDTICEHYLII